MNNKWTSAISVIQNMWRKLVLIRLKNITHKEVTSLHFKAIISKGHLKTNIQKIQQFTKYINSLNINFGVFSFQNAGMIF